MAERINQVLLVLDRDYDGELASVPANTHVWLVDSPANRQVAANYRALHGGTGLETGATTFKALDDDPASETCLKVLGDIDLHHGEYSSDPPYTVLEVVGARLSASVKRAIEALGFSKFERTEVGFRATR